MTREDLDNVEYAGELCRRVFYEPKESGELLLAEVMAVYPDHPCVEVMEQFLSEK